MERRIKTHDKERLEGSARLREHGMLRDRRPVHADRSSCVASRIANEQARVASTLMSAILDVGRTN